MQLEKFCLKKVEEGENQEMQEKKKKF